MDDIHPDLGWRHPDVFGRVGALSPSVMWGWDQLFSEWSSHTRRGSRIYLDAGDDETVNPWATSCATARPRGTSTATFQHLGYADHELRLVLEPGGQHHERDWQRRLPEAMRWLLG